MPNGRETDNIGCFHALLALSLTPVALMLVYVFLIYNVRYRGCGHLENGLNLGYEAVFDLSRSFFQPIAVPRFSDGTPLVRDETWALFVTPTTVHGWAYPAEYSFAWRAGTGLVLSYEDREAYERLIAEAGVVNWGRSGKIDTAGLLNELKDDGRFDVDWCPTAFLTW